MHPRPLLSFDLHSYSRHSSTVPPQPWDAPPQPLLKGPQALPPGSPPATATAPRVPMTQLRGKLSCPPSGMRGSITRSITVTVGSDPEGTTERQALGRSWVHEIGEPWWQQRGDPGRADLHRHVTEELGILAPATEAWNDPQSQHRPCLWPCRWGCDLCVPAGHLACFKALL